MAEPVVKEDLSDLRGSEAWILEDNGAVPPRSGEPAEDGPTRKEAEAEEEW